MEAYWNGELSISYDALKKTSAGEAFDIATIVPEYAANELPISQLFKSFIVGPAGKKQVRAFKKMYAEIPELTQELHQNNVEPIFFNRLWGWFF